MTPLEALRAARQAGATLRVDGDALHVRTPAPLPPELLAELRQHKPALLALLAPDPLTAWLDAPPPLHVEPPTERPTAAALDALGARLAAFLERGEAAIEGAPLDHPRRAEALRHFEHLDARLAALGRLLAALRGQPYDRAGLARWCAGQAFATGDLAAVLPLVDAAAEVATRQAGQDARISPQDAPQGASGRPVCTGCGTRVLAPWEPSPDGTCAWCTNTARARAGLPPLMAEPVQDAGGCATGWTWRPVGGAEGRPGPGPGP